MQKTQTTELKEIIDFINGKQITSDKMELLLKATTTVSSLIFPPVIVAGADSMLSLMGSVMKDKAKDISNILFKTLDENNVIKTFERCRYSDVLLARKALKKAIYDNLRDKEGFLATWKLNKMLDSQVKESIQKNDSRREESYWTTLQLEKVAIHEVYWEALLNDLVMILDIEVEDVKQFVEYFLSETRKCYDSYVIQVQCGSEIFKHYKHNTIHQEINDSLFEKLESINQFIKENSTQYKTIDQYENWLKESTYPSISLNFFNYEDKEFEDKLIANLSEDIIYVQGKTREEVVLYILYILKYVHKEKDCNTYIVESIEQWNRLDGKCKGKILIPHFNSNVVQPICGNVSIISFGSEEYIGSKLPIKLNKRIIRNMHDMLYKEINDFEITNKIINQSNGLYSSFKRMVFKGKNGYPSWESAASNILIPVLLIGEWTRSSFDLDIIRRIAGIDYNEYEKNFIMHIGGEDPLLIEYEDFNKKVIKLANVEESWEILEKYISIDVLEKFKEIACEVILDIPPKFNLPIDDHYMSSILVGEPRVSSELRSGLIRSLVMLSNREISLNRICHIQIQSYLESIIKPIFEKVNTQEKWFAVAEIIDEIVEAAPNIVLTQIENELRNEKSYFWGVFEKQSQGFFGSRNYYTHVLWALEKALCFEEYVPRTVNILAKIAEKNIKYTISNSPMATLERTLCAWLHDVNISIEDKIRLTEQIVKNYTIGWELLTDLLPDRSPGKALFGVAKPRYKYYRQNYELESSHDVFNTYKAYTELAISMADLDLNKWSIIFKKLFFFEFNLEDNVISGVQAAIKEETCDKRKYEFKEVIRELIHQHRYFKNSAWAIGEDQLQRIEKDVFNLIEFNNEIYDYLYLFINHKPHLIHPTPYKESEMDFGKEEEEILAIRTEGLVKIYNSPELGIVNLLKSLPKADYGYSHAFSIGTIVASKLHEYTPDFDFIIDLLEVQQTQIFLAYVDTIMQKEGLPFVKKLFDAIEIENGLKVKILTYIRMDTNLLDYLSQINDSISEKFWSTVEIRYNIKEENVFETVWDNLLKYKNYHSALELLHDTNNINILRSIELLQLILDEPIGIVNDTMSNYYIEELFKYFYSFNDLDSQIKDSIFQLEIGYFNLLAKRVVPKFIMNELKFNPDFLAELVSYIYKKEGDETDKSISDADQQRIARLGYNILYDLKFCPCCNDNNDIIPSQLDEYVARYLKLIEKNNQVSIGKRILGECLSKSPSGSDKYYPHESVRMVFEKYYDENLSRGFYSGVVYGRGVVTSSSGVNEKALAVQYDTISKRLLIDYPHMSSTLKFISEHFLHESISERERASYGD